MAVAMAREIRDRDFVASGTGVPLAVAAMMLAKRAHAPHLSYFFQGTLDAAYAGPAAVHVDMPRIFRSAVAAVSYQTILDLELRGRVDFHFLRPVQVDCHGNINGSVIGSLERPRLRFHGLGLGDVVGLVRRVCLYLTEHSPRVLPQHLDFRTGLGQGEGERVRASAGLPGGGPVALVTPLCVMDFQTPDHRARVRSVFPEVTLEEIQTRTGFDLNVDSASPLAPPTEAELATLNELDPLRARRLEFRAWRGEARRRLAAAQTVKS